MHGLMEYTYGLIRYMPVLINICTDKKKLHNKTKHTYKLKKTCTRIHISVNR